MRIYNSLTRKIEEFKPISPPNVGIYSCGPTVYDTAHVGNFRTYTLHDVLHRTLEFLGYKVKFVSNITDVGHLVSDADEGEDKLEKGARREGLTAWEIAKKYTEEFFEHEKSLNILPPDVRCRATQYIDEQIKLVKRLEEKGFTYRISDGIYFDTSKMPNYGELIRLDKSAIREGARVEKNPEKKDPTDFALWKFSPKDKKRDMEWDSPWGRGFPGWHIECSAMSMKHLGEQFDIHVGGTDIKSTHHVNEIAQSEAATGKKPFAKYWVHGELLMVDGGRMGKSLGNMYTLDDVEKKGFEPLALRYLYLTAHYRDPLNFTWESLEAAQNGLNNLRSQISGLKSQKGRTALSVEKDDKIERYREQFLEAISDDLDMPKALATLWAVLKSNIPSEDKYGLALSFDEVLGLSLSQIPSTKIQVPENIKLLIKKREDLRKEGKFEEADEVRKQIESRGFVIEDTSMGPKVRQK